MLSEQEQELNIVNSELDKTSETLSKREQELVTTRDELHKTTQNLNRSEYLLDQVTLKVRDLKLEILTLKETQEKYKTRLAHVQSQLTAAQTEIGHMTLRRDVTEEEKSFKREQEDPPNLAVRSQMCPTGPLKENSNKTFSHFSPPPASTLTPPLHQQQLDKLISEPSNQCYALERTNTPGKTHTGENENSNHLSIKELDRIARNISRFEPKPDGANDISIYLNDIDFYLRRFPNATAEDRIYLIRLTSSRNVGTFIDRQSPHVKSDFDLLRKSLTAEFSDCLTTGLTAALAVKQTQRESPKAYYCKLRDTYFGSRNELDMEEDVNFKSLFLENLHPTTSYHLGIAACPRTQTSCQLRELAMRAFMKQKQSMTKHREAFPVLSLESNNSQQLRTRNCKPNSSNRLCFPAKKHKGELKQVQSQQEKEKRKRPLSSPDLECKRDPFHDRKCKPKQHSQPGGHHTHHSKNKENRCSPKHHQRHKKSDFFPPEEHETNQNTDFKIQVSDLDSTSNLSDLSEDEQGENDNLIDQLPDTDGNELLPLATLNHQSTEKISIKQPFKRFLCNLTKKDLSQKLYLPALLENELRQEAILDTGADISIMSTTLLSQLQEALQHKRRKLKLHSCFLEIQPYGDTTTVLTEVAFIRLTIGPMTAVHPFFVSSLDLKPLLIGKDLLNRFEPLIDFKELSFYAQVQKPLPFSHPRNYCEIFACGAVPHKVVSNHWDYNSGSILTQDTQYRPQINFLCRDTAPREPTSPKMHTKKTRGHLHDLRPNNELGSLKAKPKQTVTDGNPLQAFSEPQPTQPGSVQPTPTRHTPCLLEASLTASTATSTPSSHPFSATLTDQAAYCTAPVSASSFAISDTVAACDRPPTHPFGLWSRRRVLPGPDMCVSNALISPILMVNPSHRGVALTQAHKSSLSGPKGTQITRQPCEKETCCPQACDKGTMNRFTYHKFLSSGKKWVKPTNQKLGETQTNLQSLATAKPAWQAKLSGNTVRQDNCLQALKQII